MTHDLISIILLGLSLYIGFLSACRANNVKSYVTVNSFMKMILGFFFFRGNSFSLKSIVGQIGNLFSVIAAITWLSIGYSDPLGLFLTLEVVNIFVVFIVSLFVNK